MDTTQEQIRKAFRDAASRRFYKLEYLVDYEAKDGSLKSVSFSYEGVLCNACITSSFLHRFPDCKTFMFVSPFPSVFGFGNKGRG